MQYTFHRWNRDGETAPASGVLRLTPASPADAARRDLAMLVLEHGVEGFTHGSLPITQIELPAEPTLDDMLAAEFLSWLIAGEELPDGAGPLARYAKLAREGLRLGALPLESSLEGIYQAVRNSVPEDLSQPQNAAAFLSAWQPLVKRLRQAARAGQDPFTARLFDDAEFSRERAFLEQDHKVYRQDVARGERWRVKMPGGPPEASALLLRKPKSLLFKHWSREDSQTTTGEPYLLMGVQWGAGDWVFSTDPVQRISLKALADRLQAAEAEKDPASAKSDPWFDGQPFGHTLVASPKGLSKLGDEQIIQIVSGWANKHRSAGIKPAPFKLVAIAAACLVAVSIAGLAAVRLWQEPQYDRGLLAIRETDRALPAGPRTGKDFALLFATNEYESWDDLNNPMHDAKAIEQLLKNTYGFETQLVPNPTWKEFDKALADWQNRAYQPDDQLFIFIAGHGDFREDSKQGFIVCKDAAHPKKNDRSLCISQADLKHRIETIPCDHVFLVIDTCYGGTIDFGTAVARERGSGMYQEVSKQEFIKRNLGRPFRYYLASGGKQTVPDGVPGQHSPFAHHLLNALKSGGDETGILTQYEIIAEVKKNKVRPRYGRLYNHVDEGDFLFIRKQTPIVLSAAGN